MAQLVSFEHLHGIPQPPTPQSQWRTSTESVVTEFIPYSLPDIGEAEIDAVVETLRSGWVTSGPAVSAFESEFASFVGGGVEAIAVNSATAGLHLALEACGVRAGDEVIVPTWTFTATAEVVRYLGADPVVVDVDRSTLNMDIERLAEAITSRTKAVIVVHFGGLSLDMLAVKTALGNRDIKVIEDSAHALPSSAGHVVVGSATHSDVAVFSFYANKTMTTGEGGMMTTRDPAIAGRARTMRLHGIDRDVFDRYRSTKASWAYDIVAPGFKYNLPDPAAAMGRVQLTRVKEMRDRRQEIADLYSKELSGLPIDLPARGGPEDTHAWHLYVVRVSSSATLTRDEFIDGLLNRQVGCSVHFIPLHMHTYWRESLGLSDEDFPVASAEFANTVSLPIFSRMSDGDVERVIAAIKDVFKS